MERSQIDRSNWFLTHRWDIRVDSIGYFECLHEDFAYIEQKIGSNSNLQHLNKTEGAKKDYRDYYTDATLKIVEDVYAEDIRIFGYDFDNSSLKRT